MTDPDQRYIDGYRAGLADAVRWLAVWRHGEQHVGVMRRPLAEVLDAISTKPIGALVREGW